ncbi:MAG: hypothetical protein A4E49_02515 [Methanosaeta sp. PtaU1.Bin112]|nr:MAG: hypothetical protein A4E49_02515 [Methanosaeta sp. PtaU1.Bin112]
MKELKTKPRGCMSTEVNPVISKSNGKVEQNEGMMLSNYAILQQLPMKRACNNISEASRAQAKAFDGDSHALSESKAGTIPQSMQQAIHSPGRPLDPHTCDLLESIFDMDFSKVRIHSNKQAANSARVIEAQAYTIGRDIVIGENEYKPWNSEGQRLLVHEATHIAHAAHASSIRTGIAPDDSLAERKADAIAITSQDSFGKNLSPSDLQDWGPAWQIHPHRISRRGRVVHEEDVRIGRRRRIGSVEARSDEEVVEEAEVGSNPIVEPNLFALEFTARTRRRARRTSWLQFVWTELIAETARGPVRKSGSFPLGNLLTRIINLAFGCTKHGEYTTNPNSPIWNVDSYSCVDPFYEATSLNIRRGRSTTLHDRPGGDRITIDAQELVNQCGNVRSVSCIFHFDTYLVTMDRGRTPDSAHAIYHVVWTATKSFTLSNGVVMPREPLDYRVIEAGNVTELDENLRRLLHTQYEGYRHVR